MKPTNFTETVFFRAPPGTGAALAKAADLEQTKPSELMRRAALDRIKTAAAVEKVTVGEFIQRALGDCQGSQVSSDGEHGSRTYALPRMVGDCKGIG
jgi:hypothetical protein